MAGKARKKTGLLASLGGFRFLVRLRRDVRVNFMTLTCSFDRLGLFQNCLTISVVVFFTYKLISRGSTQAEPIVQPAEAQVGSCMPQQCGFL